jgi:hypothetical protein
MSSALMLFGFPDGFMFKGTMPVAALAYLAIGTVGASWPRWVRLAVFGAGYTLVMAVVQPFGMFPTLRWTEVLAPLPLLPLLAVVGGWLGCAAGRMMGRLTGDV